MFKYLIIILVFFCSCQNIKKDSTIIFSKFPKQESVSLHNFIEYDNGVISRMFLTDSALIVYNWRGQGGYFFYEYGLHSKKKIHQYIPHGRGKGKALGSLSAGLYNKSLWMYDISLNKIIFSDLNTPSSSANAITYKEYPFAQKYYNIQFLSDTKIVANGNYQTPNKIQEVGLLSGKILADYGVFKNVPEDIPFYAWKHANEAFMALNSTKDKIILAHQWSDEIEIFNLKSHKSITVKGPENFKPEFSPFKGDNGRDLIGANENSRNAFSGLVVTNKYVYALYSGNNVHNAYINYGKTLYVFDLEGKPVKKINFDRYVAGFTVSKDDKTLYAYDVIAKFIVTTKI